jgi:hypothetical protein
LHVGAGFRLLKTGWAGPNESARRCSGTVHTLIPLCRVLRWLARIVLDQIRSKLDQS